MAVSESCVNALSHDACIAVICRDSFGFVWLLRPVSAAINIVGKEIDAPTSNSRNIVTVVAKICCEVWIFSNIWVKSWFSLCEGYWTNLW